MDTGRLRRYLKPPLGHSSASTRNVRNRVFSHISRNTLIMSIAVVLANVLGFFDPIRALIKDAIDDGFIQPVGINLVRFVDGPSDHSLHESFDWGKALLEELDAWKCDPSYSIGFDWTRPWKNGVKSDSLQST